MAHALFAIQGIVNRQVPTLVIRFLPETDDFWWAHVRSPGEWMADREVVELGTLNDVIAQFKPAIRGLVVYDERVAATSNIASTIAGVEDRVPVRYDPSEGSMHARLVSLKLGDELKLLGDDGSPMFTGKGTIPGTSLPSTGTPKGDAYLWAKARYLDRGKCGKEFMAFYLDAYWLTKPNALGSLNEFQNSALSNHDFFISRRSFFFDLGMWADEAPVDDPAQALGTDVTVLKSLLKTMHAQARGEIFTVGGFPPWGWKYSGPIPGTDFVGTGGQHHPVHSEWEYARIISGYNGIKDADALGHSGMANSSFYQHHPLKDRYPQNAKPTLADLKGKGLIEADSSVKKGTYVTWYMGDYDASSWLNKFVPQLWADPQRGKLTCNWAFNPNLDKRVPHVMHYVRTRATENDWFISGDNGAGYLNPGELAEPRIDPEVPDGWNTWIAHNERYFKKYDLTVTGFVIEGFGRHMGDRGFDAYATFSPGGMMIATNGKELPITGVHQAANGAVLPYVSQRVDVDGLPAQGAAIIAATLEQQRPAFAGGPQFLSVRTVLKTPTWHADVEKLIAESPGGDRIRFVDAHTFYLLVQAAEAGKRQVDENSPSDLPGK